MDITFLAVPQAAVCSSAFWNEQLCDAPLKLVQHGIVHHLQHCQRGAAASPYLPVTMGLQGEVLSVTSWSYTLHPVTERALPPHFTHQKNRWTTLVATLKPTLKYCQAASFLYQHLNICYPNFSRGRRTVQQQQQQCITLTKTGTRKSCCFWTSYFFTVEVYEYRPHAAATSIQSNFHSANWH